ncbi:MAG: ParA family protein, partial [Gammaproteobacteria bacterium]|nr:ParA family protein [Gammaproteobacteria bacterium]
VGIEKGSVEKNIYHVIIEDQEFAQIIKETSFPYLSVAPSSIDLIGAELELVHVSGREARLRHALSVVRDRYDYIIIDCPPTLNMATINALTAADGVIIPMQCEYYALEGLTALLGTIEQIQSTVNSQLELVGLLRTMFDPRNNLANQVSSQLILHFGDKVYRTLIPRNVRLAEAPSHGLPVLLYDKNSRGALSYLALAGEILRKEEKSQAVNKQATQEKQEQQATV